MTCPSQTGKRTPPRCLYLTVCTMEVRDKVIRSKSVSIAIDRKWY